MKEKIVSYINQKLIEIGKDWNPFFISKLNMKKILKLILLTLLSVNVYCQEDYDIREINLRIDNINTIMDSSSNYLITSGNHAIISGVVALTSSIMLIPFNSKEPSDVRMSFFYAGMTISGGFLISSIHNNRKGISGYKRLKFE
jgi:hypothetical protein